MKLKIWLLMLVVAMVATSPAIAEDATAASTGLTAVVSSSVVVDPVGINLSSVFGKLRGGTLYTFVPQGMTLGTLYAPIVSFHANDGTELITLNAGAAINVADGKGSPLASIGCRLDGMLKKSTAGEWAKTHITTAELPPIEFAAAGMWYAPEHTWTLGVNLAVRFSE
ncbi:MAG: hypothetical protein WCS77_00120 [Elusimicrobiaceae bacterium]|jgi:hypothetical protein